MLFSSGECFVGEFNENFEFHGEGMFFFAIGALLRGMFVKGKINGASMISMPDGTLIFANFKYGTLEGKVLKIMKK